MILIILSLAAWRITYMFAEEEGPGGIFTKLRNVDSSFNPLSCFYCTSVWVAGVVSLVAGHDVYQWFALSAASIFINILHDRVAQ